MAHTPEHLAACDRARAQEIEAFIELQSHLADTIYRVNYAVNVIHFASTSAACADAFEVADRKLTVARQQLGALRRHARLIIARREREQNGVNRP